MKKKILLIGLAVAMAAAITGCGTSEQKSTWGTATENNTVDSAKRAELQEICNELNNMEGFEDFVFFVEDEDIIFITQHMDMTFETAYKDYLRSDSTAQSWEDLKDTMVAIVDTFDNVYDADFATMLIDSNDDVLFVYSPHSSNPIYFDAFEYGKAG